MRDRLVSRALGEGYRAVLPHGVYPAALLFLEVPLEEVDVNVHPAKTEVRFRRAQAVADAVREAVRGALAAGGYVRIADNPDERGVVAQSPNEFASIDGASREPLSGGEAGWGAKIEAQCRRSRSYRVGFTPPTEECTGEREFAARAARMQSRARMPERFWEGEMVTIDRWCAPVAAECYRGHRAPER